MSKRDYQAIARAIFKARAYSAGADRIAGITSVTERIADTLAADNPRFDRARFLEACETGACKGMPKRATSLPSAATCPVCGIRSRMPGRERCSVCVGTETRA